MSSHNSAERLKPPCCRRANGRHSDDRASFEYKQPQAMPTTSTSTSTSTSQTEGSDDAPPFELFHAIGDGSSARVRRFVVDREFEKAVRFRNVSYAEVITDLLDRGGQGTPALWDGERLITGADAIETRLLAWRDVGRQG
jgi:hypothetical protein